MPHGIEIRIQIQIWIWIQNQSEDESKTEGHGKCDGNYLRLDWLEEKSEKGILFQVIY